MTLELKGLITNHPASILAAYGLYEHIPSMRMLHVKDWHNHYHPVIEGCNDFDELTNHLLNSDATTSLCQILELADELKCPGHKIDYDIYGQLRQIDEVWVNALRTDHILDAKGDVTASPYYLYNAQPTPFKNWPSALEDIDLKREKVAWAMTHDYTQWDKVRIPFQNFGWNPDQDKDKVYDGRGKRYKNDFKVPAAILLLVLSAMRTLPCYLRSSKKVVAAGFDAGNKNERFRFPVFNKPHTRQEYISWMRHPAIWEYPKNEVTLSKLGIDRVYEVTLARKGKSKFVGWPTKAQLTPTQGKKP